MVMDIITKFNSLHSQVSTSDTEHAKRMCQNVGLKFLGIGLTRMAVLHDNNCYKFAYTLNKSDNRAELEVANLLKGTEFAKYFALPIKKINDYILHVEFVSGVRCADIGRDNHRYANCMNKAVEIRDKVSDRLGFTIYDLHDYNVMVTDSDEVKIVDFACL